MARAIENPAKMIPNSIPVAPRFFAYIGRSGEMIPTPNIEENIERESMKNIVFLEDIVKIRFYNMGRGSIY
jgi:hypothetical protein